MDISAHSIVSLFNQLGLDSTEEGVNKFINRNSPLSANIALHKADFWKPSQASCLKEMLDEDADWAVIVDQLNIMLR